MIAVSRTGVSTKFNRWPRERGVFRIIPSREIDNDTRTSWYACRYAEVRHGIAVQTRSNFPSTKITYRACKNFVFTVNKKEKFHRKLDAYERVSRRTDSYRRLKVISTLFRGSIFRECTSNTVTRIIYAHGIAIRELRNSRFLLKIKFVNVAVN